MARYVNVAEESFTGLLTAYNLSAVLLTGCQDTQRRVYTVGGEEWCNTKVYDIHDHFKAGLKQGVLRGYMKTNAGYNNRLTVFLLEV